MDLKTLLKRHGVGLTGGIGTGKSTVAKMVAEAGVPVVDADQLARAVTAAGSAGLKAIAAAFGNDVVTADGSLDRKRLGAIVFQAPERRRELERLTHPLIRAELALWLDRTGVTKAPRLFVYEATLLYETGTAGDFREVWATWCPRELQITRVMQRDQVERARAEAVLAAQLDATEKARRADVTIRTDVPLAEVAAQVQERLAALAKLAPG